MLRDEQRVVPIRDEIHRKGRHDDPERIDRLAALDGNQRQGERADQRDQDPDEVGANGTCHGSLLRKKRRRAVFCAVSLQLPQAAGVRMVAL
jgi:hypothetical protein